MTGIELPAGQAAVELTDWVRRDEPIVLDLKPFSALALTVALQYSLRRPENTGLSGDIARYLIRTIRSRFPPALAEWSQQWDDLSQETRL